MNAFSIEESIEKDGNELDYMLLQKQDEINQLNDLRYQVMEKTILDKTSLVKQQEQKIGLLE